MKFSDVYTEGITKITAADVNYAKEMGNVIKLIGIAQKYDLMELKQVFIR